MNKENVEKAIAIMKRAGTVDMRWWQISSIRDGWGCTIFATGEADMHKCGNSACFAGWVAVSPEFRADGGWADAGSGAPTIRIGDEERENCSAIAAWLDIDYCIARDIVYGDTEPGGEKGFTWSKFYNKPWKEVGAADVIAKLEAILSGELQ